MDRVMSNIVIIEDDALMRSLLAEWLTAEGYSVSALRDDDLQAGTPTELVIVDVYMPRHLGAERLRKTREAYPGVPIIAMSGQFRADVECDGRAAQALGVHGVIAKPFGRETLLGAVRFVVGPPVMAAN
jgi:DNA-binding response OmpR family regulator